MAEECKVDCITLNRRLLDWEWYQDMPTKVLFIHLLLKANWKDGDFMGIEVPRGSLITSYPKLSTQLGITVRQIRTALKHLKSTGEVTVKTYSKFSLITIVKYNDYQWSDSQSDSQVTVKRQASDNNRIKKKGNKEKSNISVPDEIDLDYDFLYQEYPKHVNKSDGRLIYRALVTTGHVYKGTKYKFTKEQIAEGVLNYTERKKAENGGEVGNLKYWRGIDVVLNHIQDEIGGEYGSL